MGKCCFIFTALLSLLFAIVFGLIVVLIKSDDVWQNNELSTLAKTSVKQLPNEIQKWHDRGKYKTINGYKMFYVSVEVQGDQKKETKQTTSEDTFEGLGDTTLILIHGYPTSSFDYHRALDQHLLPLLRESREVRNVLMFDHVGFGFSDKPLENYTYSLIDQAENAVSLWMQLGVRRAHIVSHDMGDSVLTEIITLKEKNMLEGKLSKDFFKSVTFTNGGMHYAQIGFRLVQRLLMYPSVGNVIQKLRNMLQSSGYISKERVNGLMKKQLGEVWGSKYLNTIDDDIGHIIELIEFNGGHLISDKTMSYLMDRARFEPRWFSALKKFDSPVQLYWGDSDAVSPLKIPMHLHNHVLQKELTVYKTLKDVGHFLMLERPDEWSKAIVSFINSNP